MSKLPEGPQTVYSFDLEDLLSQAHRCRDLLTGAKALLVGVQDLGDQAAAYSVLEARAQLDGIVRTLETLAAHKAEADRAEHAHRAEAARVAGGAR